MNLHKENLTRLVRVQGENNQFFAINFHLKRVDGLLERDGPYVTVVKKVEPKVVTTPFGDVKKTLEKVVPGKFDSLVDAQNALSRQSE